MRPLQEKIVAYEHVLPEIDPKKEIRMSNGNWRNAWRNWG